MNSRPFSWVAAGLFLLAPALSAQEHPVRRVAIIVSVAVEEYARGVDEKGQLTSAIEYQEASDFLADARASALRLPGERAAAQALLDSIVAFVAARRPPSEVKALERRFAAALGSEGALELPTKRLDVAEGRSLYDRTCAACHGALGMADGPAARGMNPRPTALGDARTMQDVSPATMYRVTSVGIAGTPMPSFAASLTADQRWNVVAYLMSLRATSHNVAEGEGLYTQRCAQCHGALGAGDGALAATLSRLPQEIGSLAWQATRTDQQLTVVVRDGIAGTSMPPNRELAPEQLRSVVTYLRTLPLKLEPQIADVSRRQDPTTVSREVMSLLEQSLTAARGGRSSEAGDKAFDAYIAFEPLETPARARDPGLVASVERAFAEFKGAVRAGEVRGAERARDAIEASMPSVLRMTRPTGSGLEAFWQSLLIIVREGFEAILVVGAIVAFLLKTGHRERLRSIWLGVGSALALSAITAIALKTLLAAAPMSREVIEGLTMLVSVAVLFSVSYWLISKVEAAKWQKFIQEKVNDALQRGGGTALAFAAFLAVYREGAETALFYQALFKEGAHVTLPITLGILVGGGILAVVFTLFYRYGVRVPLRQFFGVTSVLLYYMAFVFMGKGVRELQEGDVISLTTIPGAPYAEAFGLYPTVETLLAQLVLLVLFVFALVKTFWPSRSVALPTMPSDPTATVLVETQIAELQARMQALEAELREKSRSNADD